jgi:hypothetical protein
MTEYIVLLARLNKYIKEQRWSLAYAAAAELDVLTKKLSA